MRGGASLVLATAVAMLGASGTGMGGVEVMLRPRESGGDGPRLLMDYPPIRSRPRHKGKGDNQRKSSGRAKEKARRRARALSRR